MSRRVKDFIEIRDHSSLDALIEKLIEVRDGLPAAAEAEVKMRGDDIFGRQLSISFFREQTAEEAECDAAMPTPIVNRGSVSFRGFRTSSEWSATPRAAEPASFGSSPDDPLTAAYAGGQVRRLG
jgi:hypothetical protein